MIQARSEQIFIYNGSMQKNFGIEGLSDFFNFNTFCTDNLYQLHQYAQKITPQVLIFNINGEKSLSDLQTAMANFSGDIPLIVTAPQNFKVPLYSQIAHYIAAENKQKLLDIIESYSIGGKTHDVLLIDTYSVSDSPFKTALMQKGYSLFEVHNIDSARQYLARNKPYVVGVEYVPNFIPARHTLQHNRIFYVDRAQDITEIEKFLH